jgi:hypothetical protein
MTKIPIRQPSAKNTPSTSSSSAAGEAGAGEVLPFSSEGAEALRVIGLTSSVTVPDENTAVADLLLYALTAHGGARPDHGIVLSVAAELDALAMFVEGPLGITLEMMSRRIRAAVDLARQMRTPRPPEAHEG